MIDIGSRVTISRLDGTTGRGVIASAVRGRPDYWIVAVDSGGDRVLTMHHTSKLTEEAS